MKAPTLRDYQEGTLDAIERAYFDEGQTRVLVKKPTGTGKTVTFAELPKWKRIGTWLETFGPGRGAKMLVIAHREELLTQAQKKIQAANPGLMVSIEQGDLHANRYSDVIVASIQTLAAVKFRRLLRLLERHLLPLVIIDEAHHAAAASYRTALAHLGFLPKAISTDTGEVEAATQDDVAEMQQALEGWDRIAPKDRLLVGVTATPNRTDAIGLGCVFQSIAYSYPLKQAIEDGWLVPPTPWVIESDVSLDSVRTSHGDFNQKDLAEAVNQEHRNKLAVAGWREHASDRQTIAFTVDVAHAHAVAEEFRAAGVRAEAVSGTTPKEERRQILADYQAGKIQLVSNCMVLTEGTDLPMTGCILHLKPTKSATLYEQMTGRGLRLHPDDPAGPARRTASAFLKSDCVVIDVVDVARRHSLQAAPVLYGLPPGLVTKGEPLPQLEDELAALREKYPTFDLDAALAEHMTLAQLKAKASTFDIWTVPELGALADVVSMNWIRTGDDTFRVSYPWADGTETLMVAPDVLGHYDVSCTLRVHSQPTSPYQQTPVAAGHRPAGTPPATRQRTIARQVQSVREALQLAETFVRNERRSALKLKDRDAPWRAKPASDKQLALLVKWHVPHNPKGMTAGQASDLIDLAVSRRNFAGGGGRRR